MRKKVLNGVCNALSSVCADSRDVFDLLNSGEDADLRNIIVDSFQFISFIMAIEDELNIEIPDELLVYDNLASASGFTEMLNTLFEDYAEENLDGEDEDDEDDEDDGDAPIVKKHGPDSYQE